MLDSDRADALQWKKAARWQAAALVALILLAYSPTFLGVGAGFIWDDPDYILNNANLHGWAGLVRTWTEPRSLPQWYPLVHTTFWIEYQVWGPWARGYHLVNVLVHAGAVMLLWRVLLRLGFSPWAAILGAAAWGVHPVQVESVAWVTERKNTLSACFYFAAGLTLLHWAQRGGWRLYLLASACFVMALMSKTVTASLPAAWLLVRWWKQGRLEVRRDLLAMSPWLLVGGVFAMLTASLERQHVGANGPDWPWTFAERCLIAGRAVWFYLWSLAWPVRLSFVYEWTPPAVRSLLDWGLLGGVILGVALLWLLRKKAGRGPLVAALLFVGTALPALGFANVFPHRYSFVADHFQYLACGAVLAGGAWVVGRWPRAAGVSVGVGVGLVLVWAGLSFRRSFVFRNEVALWTDATVNAPGASMAWANLAAAYREELAGPQSPEEAKRAADRNLRLLKKAYDVRSSPGVHAEAAMTYGFAEELAGHPDEAEQLYTDAVKSDPTNGQGWAYRGRARLRRGDIEGAKRDLEAAMQRSSTWPETLAAVGELQEREGDLKASAEAYEKAVAAKPDRVEWQLALARVLWKRVQATEGEERAALAKEAGVRFLIVMDKRPADARVRLEAGMVALELGRRERGEAMIREAIRMDSSLKEEGEKALKP